jgi:hypothetical protein
VFYPIHDPGDQPGTIMFTSNYDCEIRLFDSDTTQLVREFYELGKAPAVVRMTTTGVFILQTTAAHQSKKEPLTYSGGNMEYYIEF